MVQRRVDALVMIIDPFFIAWRKQLVALAANSATPAILSYPLVRRCRWPDELWG
jgi:hypothetical protein